MQSSKRFKRDHNVEEESIEVDVDRTPFSEVITFTFTNFNENFSQTAESKSDYETLEVHDIPTITDAINLLSYSSALEIFYQSSYSIAIKFKINDTISTSLSPLQYEIVTRRIDNARRLFLCFESSIDKKCCLYWKNGDETPLMMLSLIDMDIIDRESMHSFLFSFLLLALRFGNDGLSQEAKQTSLTDLSLFSLADVNDKNLLMLASELGNLPVVQDLLRIGFDVNYQVDNQIAADLAWQNRHLNVLLVLLLENSLYPIDFDEDNSSTELKDFLRMTYQVLRCVKNNDEGNVKEVLEKYPNLRHFYSRDNVSAAFVALSKEKFNIYKIFMNSNVCVGPKEDIDKVLSKYNERKLEELRQIHLEYAREPPEKFLMILHSNTSVGHDTMNVNEKLDHARSAIEYLCRIDIVRLILQVVAASRNFKLIFDFNRDSVQFLDPTSSKHTRGSFFTSRQIYIAAKFLLDPQKRQEAIGTLAHELCHYAMYLVYKNSCLPYTQGDHKMAQRFHGILKLCHEDRKKEPIIGYVFNIPKDNQEMRHAELIVRVPHLLVLYNEDPDHLDKCQNLFLPLFNFFEYKVIEDMKAALPNIETEGDGEIRKFNDNRKRKRFFTLRNIIWMALISGIVFIALGLILYKLLANTNDPNGSLRGEVNKSWNAVIRHSRTREILCIGSLIHPQFVLTTAECIHKKGHRHALPIEMFTVYFYLNDNKELPVKVLSMNINHEWNPLVNDLYGDLSLLQLESEMEISHDFYPIKLQHANDIRKNITVAMVLHTFDDGHSSQIQITTINNMDCILDESSINQYLAEGQFCARQLSTNLCVCGNGEQLFNSDENPLLLGIVSHGHRNAEDCAKDNSIIVTDVGYYVNAIQDQICNDRGMRKEWDVLTMDFEFIGAIVDRSSLSFICWATFVKNQIFLTDSNCVRSLKHEDIAINFFNGTIFDIQEIQLHDIESIARIITIQNITNISVPIFPNFDVNASELNGIHIVYGYEQFSNIVLSKYYFYKAQQEFLNRTFTSFCIQSSGGPIFLKDNLYAEIYGIVIRKLCRNDCRNDKFTFEYVRLANHLDWILRDLNETNNTSTPSKPSFETLTSITPPSQLENFILGDVLLQEYCITSCKVIQMFTAENLTLPTSGPFKIKSEFDETIEGFQIRKFKTRVTSLPINVSEVFPNLLSYHVENCEIDKIDFYHFKNLIKLESVVLINNVITTVDGGAFDDLMELKLLNLNDNKIEVLNGNIFMKLTKLEIIDISENFLSKNLEIFNNTTSLKEVKLSINKISEIPQNIFKFNSNLEVIDLSKNQIKTLDSELFNGKSNLRIVDLKENVCINETYTSVGLAFNLNEKEKLLNDTRNCDGSKTKETTEMTLS